MESPSCRVLGIADFDRDTFEVRAWRYWVLLEKPLRELYEGDRHLGCLARKDCTPDVFQACQWNTWGTLVAPKFLRRDVDCVSIDPFFRDFLDSGIPVIPIVFLLTHFFLENDSTSGTYFLTYVYVVLLFSRQISTLETLDSKLRTVDGPPLDETIQ